MPWKQVQVSEQRLKFAIEASKPGNAMAGVCREHGISRQTGYLWLKGYEEGGAAAVMEERSRRPLRSPQRAGDGIVKAVREARLQRPDWGVRKLERVIRQAQPKLALASASTMQRILEREGLIRERDRQQIAQQRFERERPNELWQMDFKGPLGFNQASGPLSIQDDYSRYLLTLRRLKANTSEQVKKVLEAAFQQYGLPEWMLMDHGKPWYDAINPWGWTELTIWIMRQGVRITFSRKGHPQTQGKVERMHGAVQLAIRLRQPKMTPQWLEEFRREYNHVRTHEGIGMEVPATRWEPSPRKFQPNPQEWEYPAGWQVCRLAGEGQLRFAGKRWEVSRALRRQFVGVYEQGHRLLIHYCNMPVREINLSTGANLRLPNNPFRVLQF